MIHPLIHSIYKSNTIHSDPSQSYHAPSDLSFLKKVFDVLNVLYESLSRNFSDHSIVQITLPTEIGSFYQQYSYDRLTASSHSEIDMIIRDQMHQQSFADILQQWLIGSTQANPALVFNTLIALEDREKNILKEFFLRLKYTEDFNQCQEELIDTVNYILAMMVQDRELRKDCLLCIEANNERCQDRTSMLLNILYVACRLREPLIQKDLREQLLLLLGIAKTAALRSILNKNISVYQQANKCVLQESVQIYLYYESKLREKLNLITAISSMRYQIAGKCDWINIETLEQKVRDTYADHLIELPIFEPFMQKQTDLQRAWTPYAQVLFDKLEKLDRSKPAGSENSPEYLNWAIQQNQLLKQTNEKKASVVRQWIEEKLAL